MTEGGLSERHDAIHLSACDITRMSHIYIYKPKLNSQVGDSRGLPSFHRSLRIVSFNRIDIGALIEASNCPTVSNIYKDPQSNLNLVEDVG